MQPIFVLGLRPVDPGVVNIDADAAGAVADDGQRGVGGDDVGAVLQQTQGALPATDDPATKRHEFHPPIRPR